MALFDKNSDSVIDESELEAAPSLSFSLKPMDANENGKLEREEILERFKLYVQLKTGYQTQVLKFSRRGRPLINAKIEIVPAPFLEGIIEPGRGTTNRAGSAVMKTASSPGPLIRLGFYRVKVTSETDKIAAKYNTETTLGFESAPVTDGLDTEVTFNLK